MLLSGCCLVDSSNLAFALFWGELAGADSLGIPINPDSLRLAVLFDKYIDALFIALQCQSAETDDASQLGNGRTGKEGDFGRR